MPRTAEKLVSKIRRLAELHQKNDDQLPNLCIKEFPGWKALEKQPKSLNYKEKKGYKMLCGTKSSLHMKNNKNLLFTKIGLIIALLVVCTGYASAVDLTFFGISDQHYKADEAHDAGNTAMVDVMNDLPGTAYPASIGGVVNTPRGVVSPGDLVDNGSIPAQWDRFIVDYGVNGEGRLHFPVYEGYGNHDMQIRDEIKARTILRENITAISANGYHYAWEWDEVLFIECNVFPGNIWYGEADTYGNHDPLYSRDFLKHVLETQAGTEGQPVVVLHHFRVIDENWWTYNAINEFYKVLQDYNVICVIVGHQGGGVNNTWRGVNWVSCNGVLNIFWISPDNKLSVVNRTATSWGTPFQKTIFLSYATSGRAAVINNGNWATNITSTGATVSGKLVYEAASPTQVTVCWGTTDGGTNIANWQNSKNIGVKTPGSEFTTEITGLQPFTTYYYRCMATNSQGSAWAAFSVPFTTAGILPSGWMTSFVGYEQRPGGANFENDIFTVSGSGRDIGEGGHEGDPAIDNFQYVYKNLNGDGEIQARIETMVGNTRDPKVGIMMRETLDDSSRNVSVLLSSVSGIRLFSRSSIGGTTTKSATNTIKPPYWVKLVRNENTFSGYMSSNGSNWTQVGSNVTIAMTTDIYVGLAVTAGNRDGSRLNTSTFGYVIPTADFDPPTPNPPEFASVPAAINCTQITMEAVAGSDQSGVVEYYFDEISGNPGGTDSGWQSSPIYTDKDLQPNTEYSYSLQMRDKYDNKSMITSPYEERTLRRGDFNKDKKVNYKDLELFAENWLKEVNPVDPGLIGLWNFDEESGTTAYDSIGDNDAVIYGGSSLNGSGYITLDGSNDYAVINRTIGDDFTIAFFVKTNDTATSGQWYNGDGLVDGEVGGVTNDFGTALIGSKFGFGVGNPDVTITSTKNINDNIWHHVAATRNATTGEMKIYVDGAEENSTIGPKGSKFSPSKLHIGNLQTNIHYFKGSIDELNIFNYAISATDVEELAAGGSSGGAIEDVNLDDNGIINFSDFSIFALDWLGV